MRWLALPAGLVVLAIKMLDVLLSLIHKSQPTRPKNNGFGGLCW
jgi:hypothetical protein